MHLCNTTPSVYQNSQLASIAMISRVCISLLVFTNILYVIFFVPCKCFRPAFRRVQRNPRGDNQQRLLLRRRGRRRCGRRGGRESHSGRSPCCRVNGSGDVRFGGGGDLYVFELKADLSGRVQGCRHTPVQEAEDAVAVSRV